MQTDYTTTIAPVEWSMFRDEMNFCEFPLALLSDRPAKGVKTVSYAYASVDPNNKKPVTRRVTITGSDKWGLPTAKDDEVLLALIYFTKQSNDFTQRQVYFSRRQLLLLLNWQPEGRNYRRLEESLRRWVGVTIEYENSWYDNASKRYCSNVFHMLSSVLIHDSQPRRAQTPASQLPLPFSSITWAEEPFASFQVGFLKQLDFKTYLSLPGPAAKRAFRFLDKRLHRKQRLTIDLKEFACEKLGMSRAYKPNRILREVRENVIRPLIAAGFLAPLSEEEMIVGLSRGKYELIFARAGSSLELAANNLTEQLVGRGVTAKVAERLVSEQPADVIRAKIEIFDWMHEQGKEGDNPAGWLVKAIEDDYAPPKGFVGKAEQQRREQAAQDHRAKLAQTESDKRRKDREEREAIIAERKHVEDYLASLDPSEKQQLEERAMAVADDYQTEIINGTGSTRKMMREILIQAEVLRVCPLPIDAPA